MISSRVIHLFVSCLFVSLTAVDAAEWKAGVAKVVITPEQPTWLSGYSSRNKPAEGKVHDLWAKALAFESSDGTRLVLVTCDLGSIYHELTESVSRVATKEWKLPRKSLVINVSHTHCAPEVAKERSVFHNLSPKEEAKLASYIRDQLQPKLVNLVGDALADLQPAKLFVSQTSATFGKSCRFPTTSGIINRRYDDGVTENDVPVMQVVSPIGKLRAVLFGYPCHNTTLAFYKFCGDYAGFAQYNIQAAHPGAVALFAMGCGGDQNPYPRHGPKGLDYCRQHGRELSDAVERAMQGEQTEVHGPLRIAHEVIKLDLQPLPPIDQLTKDAEQGSGHRQRKAKYLLGQLEETGKIELTQTCPMQAASFGKQLLFVFVSGETVVDYSRKTKVENAKWPMVWVAGYCNDVFAYLPSLRVLQEGGYEGRTGIIHQLVPTPFATNVEEKVMGSVRRLVSKVSE